VAPLYNRSFLIAIVTQTFFVLANALMAHYARWISFLGGDVREVGWIMGAGSIAGLILRPWLGQWINRLGARNTWLLGYALFGISALGNLALYRLGWTIYLLRSCMILAVALVFASGLTYVTQGSPPERRTEAIGILGAGGFLGMLIGPYLGDLILGSGVRHRSDFNLLFITAAALPVLAAILFLFLGGPAPGGRLSRVRLKDFLRTARRYWPGMILLVTVNFGACMTVPFVFLADFIDARNLSKPGFSALGIYFLGHAGWGLLVRVSLLRIPDRVGRRRVLLLGILFMAFGMFSFLLVSPARAGLLILPGLLCGTGHALMFHTMISLSLESFPSEVRGTGSALTLMFLDLGLILGAPLLGQIADRHDYKALFITLGAACLSVAAIYAGSSLVGRRGVLYSTSRIADGAKMEGEKPG